MTPAEQLASKIGKSKKPRSDAMTRRYTKVWTTGLRKLRLDLGLTLTDVADTISISTSYYSLVESGYGTPSLPTALKIAKFYGVAVETIWKEGAQQ